MLRHSGLVNFQLIRVVVMQWEKAMKVIEVSESQWLMLEQGTPTVINVSAPFRFHLETANGSVIKGHITPNNPLSVTSQGDITNATLRIEASNQKPLVIEA